MKNSLSNKWNTCKYILYLISVFILLTLSCLVFFQSVLNFTGMDFFQSIMTGGSLSLMILCGAAALICFFIFVARHLSALSQSGQIRLTLLLGAGCMALQYFLLFHQQPILRYDHLKVFDGALEILRTGNLSLTANEGYFGLYPFNIAVTLFNSGILRIIQLLGIPEKGYMIALQCVYLFLIDTGIFFSWHIVRILHSVKKATLFALLCFLNPILYVCAAGCYTTTLMLPLMMGTLLLILCFLKETHPTKKLCFGFAFGLFLVFASFLRATILIAAIAFAIYLIIREKNPESPVQSPKQLLLQILAVLLGAALAFGGYGALKGKYIHGDYKDTQMPPIYYVMFAANPESRGIYNEEDYHLISAYDTLEEKEAASFEILKDRIRNLGLKGTLSMAIHKLDLTWSDGTEDYKDFWTTSRNYNTLYSWLGGSRSDFSALYCHIYHVAGIGMLLAAILSALRQRCSSPYYLILLTLLGGMIFHILWESYYIYSFGFSMLIYISASESICSLSGKQYSGRTLGFIGCSALAVLFLAFLPYIKDLYGTEYKHADYAVVQDMNAGELQPLLSGESLTQTFRTDRAFNRIGCKVLNQTGGENTSLYRMELLSETGETLASKDFYGLEVADRDYCYMKVPLQTPDHKTAYTIRLTALDTSDEYYLTFAYYNSHNYDIYPDGSMKGLNSDAKTDLTFMVFHRVEETFF